MIRKMATVFSALGVTLMSCASLTHIHQFSDTSGQAVSVFRETGFSATSYCNETFCTDLQAYQTGVPAKTTGCRCDDFAAADQAIAGINKTVLNYFEALSALSDKGAADISLSGLSGAAKDINTSVKLGIKPEEIKAASDLSASVTSVLISGKRRKSVKRATVMADAHLSLILDAQIRNMSFLRTILRQQTEETKAAFASMTAKTSDPAVRYLLALESERRSKLSSEQDYRIEKFVDALGKIRSGHHQLYEHRENLKDASFRKKLRDEAAEIRKIILDFKELR